jgi:hypothetical protein
LDAGNLDYILRDPVSPTILRGAIHDAFEQYIPIETSGLGDCVGAAALFMWGNFDSRTWIANERALVLGVLTAGTKDRLDERKTVAAWVVEYLEAAGHKFSLPRSEAPLEEIATSLAKEEWKIQFAESVVQTVFPRMEALAEDTLRTPLVSARHLIMALLEQPGAWSDVQPQLDMGKMWTATRQRIERQLTPGERIEAWPLTPGASAPEPAPESLRTLSDQPAAIDRLGRATFAETLGQRLRDAHAESVASHEPGAFMAHIHGPWGYGKSSVLNFLRTELEAPAKRAPGEAAAAGDQPWLVVDFNAWKHQRIRPPWWSLISAVYDAGRKAPEVRANRRLWRIWWRWRLRADWGPVALVALLVAIGVVGAINSTDTASKVVSGLITAGAAVFASTRVLSFGSAKAAQAYAELKTDPYAPVAQLYCRLIEAIGRPVAIFVDDLDRCDGAYVVELIEGIQTLLRNQPVTYVIAAERKWICAAFAKKYADFAGEIGEPARPLGYLFLDKLFQISAALPGLSGEVRNSYWANLLDGGGPAAEPALTAEAAARRVAGTASVEGLNRIIDEAPAAERPQLRAAAAIEITRAGHSEKLEHRLQSFTPLLEPNPRAMKRLVNAVGMAQARAFLEGRTVALDTLTRWTLIELRWPLLADYLAANIDAVALAHGTKVEGVPEPMAKLLGDGQLRAVIAPANEKGLNADLLRGLLA